MWVDEGEEVRLLDAERIVNSPLRHMPREEKSVLSSSRQENRTCPEWGGCLKLKETVGVLLGMGMVMGGEPRKKSQNFLR